MRQVAWGSDKLVRGQRSTELTWSKTELVPVRTGRTGPPSQNGCNMEQGANVVQVALGFVRWVHMGKTMASPGGTRLYVAEEPGKAKLETLLVFSSEVQLPKDWKSWHYTVLECIHFVYCRCIKKMQIGLYTLSSISHASDTRTCNFPFIF